MTQEIALERLKLTVELVPKSTWGENLRSFLPASEWDALRRATYAKAGGRCQVCGQGDTVLHCHEVWEYDDTAHVQTLKALVALCGACHEVKHIGLATIRGRRQQALEYLAAVNALTLEQARAYVRAAFRQWRERNRHEWELVLETEKGW